MPNLLAPALLTALTTSAAAAQPFFYLSASPGFGGPGTPYFESFDASGNVIANIIDNQLFELRDFVVDRDADRLVFIADWFDARPEGIYEISTSLDPATLQLIVARNDFPTAVALGENPGEVYWYEEVSDPTDRGVVFKTGPGLPPAQVVLDNLPLLNNAQIDVRNDLLVGTTSQGDLYAKTIVADDPPAIENPFSGGPADVTILDVAIDANMGEVFWTEFNFPQGVATLLRADRNLQSTSVVRTELSNLVYTNVDTLNGTVYVVQDENAPGTPDTLQRINAVNGFKSQVASFPFRSDLGLRVDQQLLGDLIFAQQPVDAIVNAGDTVTLSVQVDESFQANWQYRWFKNGELLFQSPSNNITGLTAPTLTISPATAADSDTYSCRIAALAVPAIFSDSATLTVRSEPTCPADQNFDGVLNGADFNAWLFNFSLGCP